MSPYGGNKAKYEGHTSEHTCNIRIVSAAKMWGHN